MQSIDTYDFKGKRAIIRVDFTVPLNEKLEITDDTRIRAAIPTIKKVLEKGGSVVLMSHLGRPKKGPEAKFSLRNIIPGIEARLGVKVDFADDCMGDEAAKKAAEKAEKAGKYVWEHRRGFAIAAAILLMLAFLLNGLSSCSVIMDGVGYGLAARSDPSQLVAEAQYCEMEAELQRYLDTYESTHDYDEYHFDLDTIEHDPYVLNSNNTALHQGEITHNAMQVTKKILNYKL